MLESMVEPERIRCITDRPPRAKAGYVLYWMQAAMRAGENPALWHASELADGLGLPLLVLCVPAGHPAMQAAQYRWMLSGLAETAATLRNAGCAFSLAPGDPFATVSEAASDAAILVCDADPAPWARRVRSRLAAALDLPILEVDGDSVVPLAAASPKQEWSARTLRLKISGAVGHYLDAPPLPVPSPVRRSDSLCGKPDFSAAAALAEDTPPTGHRPDGIGRSVMSYPAAPSPGPAAALERLERFLETGLRRYDTGRNDPMSDGCSGLSPWLHFGQISPAAVGRAARRAEAGNPGSPALAAFLEQLVVRRELCRNYALYRPADCEAWEGLPAWARATLEEHSGDRRAYLYTEAELERAATHDPYWNAAMKEMRVTGRLHGYMRMYWGKRLIEWHRHPADAFRIALRLNNMYELDGRDANAFAGVAWCFGLHDRPWPSRPVFGTVRAMAVSGLRKKFDADAWARAWTAPDPASGNLP